MCKMQTPKIANNGIQVFGQWVNSKHTGNPTTTTITARKKRKLQKKRRKRRRSKKPDRLFILNTLIDYFIIDEMF